MFKSGNPNDCNNYRGICVSSCLSKLFTSLLQNRLTNFLEKQNLLSVTQGGFREVFSFLLHWRWMDNLIGKSFLWCFQGQRGYFPLNVYLIKTCSGPPIRSSSMSLVIVKLFNKVLQNGKFPKVWNLSCISSIFKDGNPNDCNNYYLYKVVCTLKLVLQHCQKPF
jgi:hypothetical protein